MPLPPRPDLARLLDANLNRAREACRVLEDLSRFVLSREDLASRAKSLRHAVTDASGTLGLDPLARVASRDVPGDVGGPLTLPEESARRGAADLARANAARLEEALRVLEEAGKPASAGPPGPFKALRYQAYDLGRAVSLALGAGARRQWRLCVLLTESVCARPWDAVASEALAGGADCIQLREKTLADAELLRRASRLRAMTRAHGAALVVNDRVDLALLAGADGVHLGQSDLAPDVARRLAGEGLLIGVSTENLDQARAAVAGGADVCGLGPMFPTRTKDKPRLAGPAYAASYLADPGLSAVPHLAIGGITAHNVGTLASAGVRGVAVSAAVCAATDPAGACREIRAAFDAAPAR
ncbi:MAG: thiamine phosphate synthase [Planctomycetota bacterium]|nr:thiamine phosphate synthase [Planctomycetota bacterium]